MRLVAFSIKNFRSITKAERISLGDITVLIGPNNEGKSNILRGLASALGIISSLRLLGRAQNQLRPHRTDSSQSRIPDGIINRYYDHQLDPPGGTTSRKVEANASVFSLWFKLSEPEVAVFKRTTGISLNGTLPVELTIRRNASTLTIKKPGKAHAKLQEKTTNIALFISRSLGIQYIPAVRTGSDATNVVGNMVESSLGVVDDVKYKEALQAIKQLQDPVLKQLSQTVTLTLREFLPNIKKVELQVDDEDRYRAYRHYTRVIVDDGTPTLLQYKGDGVQSLAALSLLRHSASLQQARDVVLAIEEPEAHLHPRAIHQLKAVIDELSKKHQIILATHCPLFADRADVASNIIVERNRARPAKSIAEVRDVLGVRASDNLAHAEVVLLVEGEDDRISLSALLAVKSAKLKDALANGRLALDSLVGATNLNYKLSLYRSFICDTHVFLDADDAGRRAKDTAMAERLIDESQYQLTTCLGMDESEFEDLIDPVLYSGAIQNQFSVSTHHPKFKGKKKWSDRLRLIFEAQGKDWNDANKNLAKAIVAKLVCQDPQHALLPDRAGPIVALVHSLEARLALS